MFLALYDLFRQVVIINYYIWLYFLKIYFAARHTVEWSKFTLPLFLVHAWFQFYCIDEERMFNNCSNLNASLSAFNWLCKQAKQVQWSRNNYLLAWFKWALGYMTDEPLLSMKREHQKNTYVCTYTRCLKKDALHFVWWENEGVAIHTWAEDLFFAQFSALERYSSTRNVSMLRCVGHYLR